MSAVRLSRDGPVATLTLDRPEARNALRQEDLQMIQAHCIALGDPDLRIVVLRAAGERVFSAGADFDFALRPESGAAFAETARTIAEVPVPVVALLAGDLHGGAAELVAACDFRIGAEGVGLSIPPARIGLHYELAGLRRITALVGLQAARRLFVAAEMLGTADLLRIGFLDTAVPREDLEPALDSFLARLTTLAPLAVRGMKATLSEMVTGGCDPSRVAHRVAECRNSEDFAEGIAAVRAKRKPQFRGR